MRCPVDGETLMIADRNGVEIDYCPKCRGVWLDRGELDKIIDRSAAPVVPVVLTEPGRAPSRQDQSRATSDRDDDRSDGKRKRRDSFLSDLFDF